VPAWQATDATRSREDAARIRAEAAAELALARARRTGRAPRKLLGRH
jgi:hypothetical protein